MIGTPKTAARPEYFSNTWLREQLSSPDGDASEVWMLLMDYLTKNPVHLGETIVHNLFNFVGHNTRAGLGYLNGQDVLNGIYTGDAYWSLGFGFNVPLFVELHLNFSYFGLVLTSLTGYLLGRGITFFENNTIASNRERRGGEILIFYALYTIITSLGGLQYAVLFGLIGLTLRRI